MNTGNQKIDERSLKRLAGVNPKLVKLIKTFAKSSVQKFIVTEGLRTPERQKQLVQAGASRTLNSKHLIGRAVDLAVVVDGEVRWDWPLYRILADDLKAHAARAGVKIIAGADWPRFKDGPHFELDKSE